MSEKTTRSMDTELHNETAAKEVQQLIKNGVMQLSPDIVNKLRTKYSDENIVDSVREYFSTRREKILKVARIFMDAFERKYSSELASMSLSKFMKKTLKYKKRYNLADDELAEVQRLFESRLFNSSPSVAALTNVTYPNTSLSRAFGYPITESTDPIKPANADEYASIQTLLKIHQMYRSIHSYVIIQTMQFSDLQSEAVTGQYKPDRHDANRHVHPVLAALFLPKIDLLEERMLYASIAGIVNTRFNRERIVTKPDYELFHSMVVDPTDTVCDPNLPMKDMLNRANVQVQLWNNVYNLRNGKYFEATNMEFIAHMDACKISSVDNPDVIYLSDEGIILRRLFAVFSFRPIVVQTQPVIGVITANPLNLPVNVNTIKSIPYISYKLPNFPVANQTYHLNDTNNQVQYYMENGSFVPKITQIRDARGPLVFYVPRRSMNLPVQVTHPQLTGMAISHLQQSVRHYQGINTMQIGFNRAFNIIQFDNQPRAFYLRSVVAFDTAKNSNIILGHKTFLLQYSRDSNNHIMSDNITDVSVYNPRVSYEQINNNQAVFISDYNTMENESSNSGSIFVYTCN